MIDYSWSPSANLHLWNGTSTKVAEWNAGSTIAGSTWPGAAISNKTTLGGQSYFYIAPGEFDYFMVSKNGDETDRSGDLTSSEGYGKYRSWTSGDDWQWRTFTVRIQLENNGANVGEKGTEYVDVVFNSEALDDDIDVPTKSGYTFGGYYTGDGGTGTQLISDAGKWTTSAVDDYLDASHHWIHAGMSTTLYAKWTEIKHTVNVAVSPEGAGSVQVNSSNVTSVANVGIATQSAEMTPVAANALWKFKEWRVSSADVQLDLTHYHRDYQTSGTNSMKINATDDSETLTAVFEPRFYLVGGEITGEGDGGSGTSSGMPGWDNYTDPFNVQSASLATCSLTLGTNKNFYIMVRDKADEYSYGKSSGTLGDNMTITFVDKDNKVLFYSNGGTAYTFKITGVDGSGRPQVSVERPYQVNVGRKRVDIDGSDHDDNTGGTVAMSKTVGGDAVANGAWVPYGTGVTYTASKASGYTLAWHTASDYSGDSFSSDATFNHTADHTGNGYAKFTEIATSVTLANNGHGKVQISSTDKTSTTCGVTTTRSLTAVPNTGYQFSSWTKTSGSDYNISDASANPTTLSGLGGGESSGQTVTANFSAKTYTVTLNDDHGGSNNGSATATYDATTLSDITGATFTDWTLLGYWNTNGNQVLDASGNILADVSNYTGASHEWRYDGDVNLYAHWSRSFKLDKNGGGTDGSVTVFYNQTSVSLLSAPAWTGYHVEGYYAEVGCTNKVMEANGTLVNYSGYVSDGKWIKGDATTLYAKWEANTYTVRFENLGADAGHKGSLDTIVTFNDTINMKGGIEVPSKTHYEFGGYYISTDKGATLTNIQIIDANGNWNKGVTGYTGTKDDVASWVCAADTVLYAKWTEHQYAITVAVEGSGSVNVGSSTTAKYVTASSDITATPSVGWIFKEWQFSHEGEDYDVYVSDRSTYHSTDATIRILADHDGTLTAVFVPRYYLVGGEIMSGEDATGTGTSSGMPGWDNYIDPFNVQSASLATCSLTLEANKHFFIMVRDRANGLSYGKSGETLDDNETLTFTDQDNRVMFHSNGGTAYTFKITAINGDGRPTVSVERPYQVNVGRKRVDIDGNDHDDNTGGTVAMSKTSGGDAVANGAWVPYGTSVKYDASAEIGYSLAWFTGSDYSSQFSTDATFYHIATSTGNGYAKFTEKYTTVTISTNNSAAGSITVGGSAFTWGNTKTAGVTTKRALVVSTNTGYNFTGWALSSTPDFELQDKASDTDKEVTLAGLGGTNGSTGTLTANFTAKTYSVKLNNDHGGESSDDGTATATYDATSLSSITHAKFSGWTLLGYWNSSAVQVANADGSLIANVDGYTGAGGKWTNDAGEAVNLWAHWSRSVTLDDNGGSADGSVTVTYKGTAATPSAPTKTGYHVEAYYAEEGCTHKVMETDGTLVNYSGYVTEGKWTKTDATTLYAKWEPNTYTVTLHNDHGGESSDDGTATATYDATSLSSITHAQFEGWTLLGYWNSSAVQVADANGDLKASVSTFTDSDGKWTNTDNAEVWAHWSRTITLDDNVEQRHNGSVSVTYKGAAASHSAPASRTGYTLAGYYDDAAGTTKVMNANGTLVSGVSGYTDGSGNWTHKTAATLYAKWTSDHFIIYRTGDKDDDPRKLGTDVESYAGGTLDQSIEFRMKVRDLDMWYTLCLPFTVSAVMVWDEEDGQYYDIEPYYRTEVGATLNGGHYIIRTPKQTTDLLISEFGDWRDPTYADGYKPTANTPYIIQWHNSYFLNKYVSFFGATGQAIPTSFTAGAAPSADNVVNVHGNNSMKSGSVAGAYLFEADYGNGAWLRSENVNEARMINPFECYVRASSGTTGRFLVIRRGMTIEDTATARDDVLNSETKEHILVYSLSGICVTQLHDCSLTEAGQRLSESLSEGLYILYAGNESVKLMVGGK